MTLPQTAICVLFFRNSCIWDSIDLLLEKGKRHGAEYLLRPLLEGVIIFEWCSMGPDSRAFRFRLSAFKNTVDHLKTRNIKTSKEKEDQLKEAIEDLKKHHISELPDIKQMSEDLKQSKT